VSSKPRSRLQSLVITFAILGGGLLVGAGATMPDGRPTPTGLEVPRWISLKSSQVRARSGPGLDYRILWEYRASGLPVQVIAETREWRKICDPEGSVAWIHRTVASGRRSVFNTGDREVPIYSGRSTRSALRARLSPRSTIGLDECKDGWCRIGAHRLHGWVRQDSVFGVQSRALCNAARPAGPARD